MMDKKNLRKADIFSGGIICVIGLWIISQSLKMPMKDSWGGVQNVWFVSPAIFPLFVGAMIVLLGALLIRKALKEVGLSQLREVFQWFRSSECVHFLKSTGIKRFYAMVVLLFSYVFLNIPRVDFFLCSVLFLLAFISMFYFDDDDLLYQLLRFYVLGTVVFIVFLAGGIVSLLTPLVPHVADWLVIVFIGAYGGYTWKLIRKGAPVLHKKFKLALTLSTLSPFLVGVIFKYLLLVPMPTEGLVVFVMDAIRYWDF